MRKLHYSAIAVLTCGFAWGADWLTDGGNAQRTAWQKDEHILTKENVKNLQILWKLQLDNKPKEMHSLFAPLIVSNVSTPEGKKQIAIEAGISDNVYAIDVEAGKILWQKHFEYPPITEGRGLRPGDPLCPGGQTATPVIGPPAASGTRVAYAMAANGQVHTLNVANGEEMSEPFKLGFGNGKNYALNLWNGV